MNRPLGAILLLVLLAAAARADTIWVAAAGANPLELKNVTVTGIADGKMMFQSGGRDASRELSTVWRLQIDDEPALSKAEEAFVAGKFDPATDGYLAALQSTAKPWLRPRIARRLIESGQKTNRFDATAAGYIALVQSDPQAAATMKPALPGRTSTYLSTAITQVNAALADTKLSPAQRQTLQAFLLDLQRARGDKAPQAGASPAKAKLDAAAAALAAKDFAKAINEINANRALFTDPADQALALFDLAEAQAGLAAGKTDAPAWQDAALAYMRVAAHFPSSPLAAQALLKTAQIEGQNLSDSAAARTLYEQIAAQYPSDPAAAAAKQQLQQMGKSN